MREEVSVITAPSDCREQRGDKLLYSNCDNGVRVQGSGFRVQGSGLRVQGSSLRLQSKVGVQTNQNKMDKTIERFTSVDLENI